MGGKLAAKCVNILPVSNDNSGNRWQLSGAKTKWRPNPNICLAANGTCSTGQRSKYILKAVSADKETLVPNTSGST
ncbi:MAG: hypothetical protein HC804_02975 [Anaerolineae bacterium]|nr:hypothetical protein [Anaerolineae bacterium]